MRTTVIQTATVERKTPYKENYHQLVDQNIEINVKAVEAEAERAVFEVDINITFVQRDDKQEMGRVSAKARTTLTGTPIPLKDGKFDGDNAPEHLLRLIEGAVGEDLLLPLSLFSRQARMPAIIPSPHLFARPGEEADAEEDYEEDVGQSDAPAPPRAS